MSRLYPPFSPHLDLKLDARPSEAALSLQPKRSRSEVIESLAFSSRDVLVLWCANFPKWVSLSRNHAPSIFFVILLLT